MRPDLLEQEVKAEEAINNFPEPARTTVGQLSDKIDKLEAQLEELEAEKRDLGFYTTDNYEDDDEDDKKQRHRFDSDMYAIYPSLESF